VQVSFMSLLQLQSQLQLLLFLNMALSSAGDGSFRIHLGPHKPIWHLGRPRMLHIRLLAVFLNWAVWRQGELLMLCESQCLLARVPFQTLPNCCNLIKRRYCVYVVLDAVVPLVLCDNLTKRCGHKAQV